LAKSQDSAALSGRFISPPNRRCQRLLSTNRRIIDQNLAPQRSPGFWTSRRTWATILRRSEVNVYIESPGSLRELSAFNQFKGLAIFHESVAFPLLRPRNIERSVHPWLLVILACLLAYDPRTSMRYAMLPRHPLTGLAPVPGCAKISSNVESRRMLMEFGGTVG
jgi:hypothetical protein